MRIGENDGPTSKKEAAETLRSPIIGLFKEHSQIFELRVRLGAYTKPDKISNKDKYLWD